MHRSRIEETGREARECFSCEDAAGKIVQTWDKENIIGR